MVYAIVFGVEFLAIAFLLGAHWMRWQIDKGAH